MAKTSIKPAVARYDDTLYIDGGNAFVQAIYGDTKIKFPHSIAELDEVTWRSTQDRFGDSKVKDFINVGKKYYVVGETAQSFYVTKLSGRAKYTRDYYGLLFARTVVELNRDERSDVIADVNIMASHTPQDFPFRKQLKDSIKGKWAFTCNKIKYNLSVNDVQTYDEPFGSYANVAFVKKAVGRYDFPCSGKVVGVIDIGGGTCSCLMVDGEGHVQHAQSDNGTMGINDSMALFKRILEEDYNETFAQSRRIPEDRLRDALQHGKFVGKGRALDCKDQAARALTPLLNEINSLYISKFDGGVSVDRIVLTGGGSILLEDRLKEMLDHGDVQMADISKEIQYANVSGAKTYMDVKATYL